MQQQPNHRRALRIQHGLSDRDTRVAALIVEGLRNKLDLLDHQEPAVLEAIIAYLDTLPKNSPECLLVLRSAIRGYTAHALKEAKQRERRLFYGITGKPPEPEPEEGS